MIGVLLKATWIPGVGCAITETDNKLLAITFIYSMVFDFIVLMLTGYKLFQPAAGRSRLVVLIFNDGLVYFAIAFFVNLIATVCIHIHKPPPKELTHTSLQIFMIINLNPIMSIIANVPAAIASTVRIYSYNFLYIHVANIKSFNRLLLAGLSDV